MRKECKIDGCTFEVKNSNLCEDHYKNYMKNYMNKRYRKRREEFFDRNDNRCNNCFTGKNLEIVKKNFGNNETTNKALTSFSNKKLEEYLKDCVVLCKECRIQKIKSFSRKRDWKHGTNNGYKRCNCDKCKKAHAEYRKEMRNRNK